MYILLILHGCDSASHSRLQSVFNVHVYNTLLRQSLVAIIAIHLYTSINTQPYLDLRTSLITCTRTFSGNVRSVLRLMSPLGTAFDSHSREQLLVTVMQQVRGIAFVRGERCICIR